MKQKSTTIDSYLANPNQQLIFRKLKFAKYLFFFLLASCAMFMTSCQKENQKNNCVPFKGEFTLSLIENGVSGTGTGSHIGKFTLIAHDDESNFPNITGTVIITSANGDQIFATHSGFAQELGKGMLKVDFVNTITGGTGRFSGATGSFDIHALVDESVGTGNATFNGTICY